MYRLISLAMEFQTFVHWLELVGVDLVVVLLLLDDLREYRSVFMFFFFDGNCLYISFDILQKYSVSLTLRHCMYLNRRKRSYDDDAT